MKEVTVTKWKLAILLQWGFFNRVFIQRLVTFYSILWNPTYPYNQTSPYGQRNSNSKVKKQTGVESWEKKRRPRKETGKKKTLKTTMLILQWGFRMKWVGRRIERSSWFDAFKFWC